MGHDDLNLEPFADKTRTSDNADAGIDLNLEQIGGEERPAPCDVFFDSLGKGEVSLNLEPIMEEAKRAEETELRLD